MAVNKQGRRSRTAGAFFGLLAAGASTLQAQSLAVAWHSVGGGGVSTGGAYAVSGSVGPGTGASSGGTYGLEGGFWGARHGVPPLPTTQAASGIGAAGATLNGTVNSNGLLTTAYFEYGSSLSYGSTSPSQDVGAGSAPISVGGGAIAGLPCGSTYHYRLTATNVAGTAVGADATFSTSSCPPAVATGFASSINMNSATLNATVNPRGSATSGYLEHGPTAAYGSSTSMQALGSGSGSVPLTDVVSGLACGATYHFRATASNSAGTVVGADRTFMTSACPTGPEIYSFTASPTMVTSGGAATLSWSAVPGASLTLDGTPVASPSGTRGVSPLSSTTYSLVATNGLGSTTRVATVTVNDGTYPLGTPSITAPANAQTMLVTGVSFSWDAVGGAAGYDLRVFDANTGVVQFSGSLIGGASSSTLISLPAGEYRFAVRACSAEGFTGTTCGQFATQPFTVSPVAPTGAPSVTFPTQGSTLTTSTQTLQWTSVTPNPALEGAASYEVLLSNLQTGTTALQINTTGLSTIFTMGSSTEYQLKVRACQAGCGPWSTAVTFVVDLPAVPVAAPAITSCSVSGGNSLTCSWGAVTNADTYQILVVQPNSGPGGSALTVAAQQVSGLTVTVPVPSGAATVVIRACNGDGCGPDATSPINAAGPNSSSPILGSPTAGTVVSGPTVFFAWNRIPTDNSSNTTYRLYVQDLSRQAAALDVYTTSNFYSAYFKAEGARYDALVIANPGVSQVAGPAAGFNVAGSSATAPTMVSPAHNSTVSAGNITLSWSTVPGATLYEYFVAVQGQPSATVRGVTPGLLTQVPLSGSVGGIVYSGIVRACPAGLTCQAGSDTNWGPWSVDAGPGVTNFTVTNVP